MGKFDRVLIACDFDNTLVYTEDALHSGGEIPPVSAENRRAIESFMAQGGTFCMSTGRALPAFRPLAAGIPMNGPTVLFNGAAIYDFFEEKYLSTAFLPDRIREHIHRLEVQMPHITYEIYHDDNSIFAVNPNEITEHHLHLTHSPTVVLDDIDQAPSPISKLLFEEEPTRLEQLYALLLRQPWISDYEVVRSASTLLELTIKGANKGGMVRQLAALLGKDLGNTYCIGDHANDIPMLRLSAIPFAPANAIESVRSLPGIHLLPDCRENALAAMLEVLDSLY